MSTSPPIVVHRARNPWALYIGLGLLAAWILVPLALCLSDPQAPSDGKRQFEHDHLPADSDEAP